MYIGISSFRESELIKMIQNYLEKIKNQYEVNCLRAVIYVRYSSDNQRVESIDAQIRLIKEWAKEHNIIISAIYADEAQTAKRDDRKQFQQMMSDSKRQNDWQLVLVHKLDRFARNRIDSAIYRSELRKNKKYLISTTEQFDDSPESSMMEAIIEAMAEYYSKNLSREVMKGLTENALKGKFCGGIPPLGYDIQDGRYVLNTFESQAVRLIYSRFLEGLSYSKIIIELNEKGYRTKRNALFTNNSLYEILRNERYTGTFVYNKIVSRDEFTGNRSRHKCKPESDIIRVENMIPAIISKTDFQKAQCIFNSRRRKYTNNAKETYLLSGKIRCGVCGGSYIGTRKFNGNGTKYIAYQCNIKRRSAKLRCDNDSISRDWIETIVLQAINDYVIQVNDKGIADIYEECIKKYNQDNSEAAGVIKKQIVEIDRQLDRISEVVSITSSSTMIEKLLAYEKQKEELNKQLRELKAKNNSIITIEELKALVVTAKKMLKEKSLPRVKELIDLIVKEIIINKDNVEIHLHFGVGVNKNILIEQRHMNKLCSSQ